MGICTFIQVPGKARRVFNLLRLELQAVLRCLACVSNQTYGFCKSSTHCQLLSNLSSLQSSLNITLCLLLCVYSVGTEQMFFSYNVFKNILFSWYSVLNGCNLSVLMLLFCFISLFLIVTRSHLEGWVGLCWKGGFECRILKKSVYYSLIFLLSYAVCLFFIDTSFYIFYMSNSLYLVISQSKNNGHQGLKNLIDQCTSIQF